MQTEIIKAKRLLICGAAVITLFLIAHQPCEASVRVRHSNASTIAVPGKSIFEAHCTKCHGADGTKGRYGAKNLQNSKLSDEQYRQIVENGKRIMPSWKKKLSTEQIEEVIHYIKTLKQ